MEELRALKLFKGIDPQVLEALLPICKVRQYGKNTILYYENDTLESAQILVHGVIKVYKVDRFDNEIFLYFLKRGELCTKLTHRGEIICFENAECAEDCEILSLELASLQKLILTSSSLMCAFLEESHRRIASLEQFINREIVFDGTAKVAHMLAQELDEFNALKKQEIAYILNIQPETLSRILKKLHRDEVITTDSSGRIEILNAQRLNEIYQ
ncbi:MAG: Crp/Fnr family transcriptional regulator [Wolinella sp.]